MIKRNRKGQVNINATVASEIGHHLKKYGNFTVWELQDAINNQIENPEEYITVKQISKRISEAENFGYALQRSGSYYRLKES